MIRLTKQREIDPYLWVHLTDESGETHLVSTVTFSTTLHKLHAKVRTLRPSGLVTIPVNVIGP
jgi:hypothetical protein